MKVLEFEHLSLRFSWRRCLARVRQEEIMGILVSKYPIVLDLKDPWSESGIVLIVLEAKQVADTKVIDEELHQRRGNLLKQ
jgi:hypothetical protein